MASAWRRVMVYLGLVDDDEYEEYEPYDEPQIDHDSSPGRSHVFVASLAGEPIVAGRGLQVVDQTVRGRF